MIIHIFFALNFLLKLCLSTKVDCTQVAADGYIIIYRSSG